MIFHDMYQALDISEDELLVFKMSGEYYGIVYLNDKDEPHRTDGPAYEWRDGGWSWWVNGVQHRLDGPAIMWADGSMAWVIDGKQYTQEQFERRLSDQSNYDGTNHLLYEI
jgi:hypothetical protein